MSTELFRIACKNTSNRPLTHYPITCGAPLPAGALREPKGLAICGPDGVKTRVQSQVTERWPDGSAKWMVLDFEQPFAPNESREVTLVRGSAPAGKGVVVRQTREAITVTNPHFSIAISRKRFSVFHSYRAGKRELAQPGSDIVVEDLAGKRYYASLSPRIEARVILAGPLRAVVEVHGRHTAEDDSEMLTFRLRYTVLAHDPCCQLSYKFTNVEEPDTGVKLAGIRVVIPAAIGDRTTKLLRQSVHGETWFPRPVEVRENVELIAGKAISESARTRYGASAEGKIVIRNLASLRENLGEYPYYLRPGNARTDISGGLRQMYPYIGANGPDGSLLGWFSQMENHYPKAISCERNVLSFDIWPASFGELHVRRGQAKEHDLLVNLAPAARTFEEMESLYLSHEVLGFGVFASGSPPVTVTLDPAYAQSCEVLNLHRWLRYDEEHYLKLEVKLGSVGPAQAPPRGMWDFGDYVSPDRSWAHNNENDSILSMVQEYFRRGEYTSLAAALAKAKHNAHVDFIAYDPNPLRQGTMPAHCPEHTDGATYPSHMWVDGLMAAYCVTGEPDFRSAAISVGENMLRWQKKKTIFYADSRECGWPMLAFLRLYEHTREPRWLKATHEVFEFYRDNMTDKGEILYDIPHGMGTFKTGYGEFITWRACFFYHELTGKAEVKDFLVSSLKNVYRHPAKAAITGGGWACNDLFPAWAIYKLTGERRYLEDNFPFLKALMDRPGNFPWGGNDMHFYLGELDRLGLLRQFV